MSIALGLGLGVPFMQGFGASYYKEGLVLDYSTEVGPFQIIDQSDFGNLGTLYTGRYISTDGVTDFIDFGDVSSYVVDSLTLIRFRVRPATTSVSISIRDGISDTVDNLIPNVWQWAELETLLTVDFLRLGADSYGSANSAADWSDLTVTDAFIEGDAGGHWTLADHADLLDAGLDGLTVADSGPNQLHGTCDGCNGATGEGIDPQVAGIVGLDDKMWFDAGTNSITLDATIDLGTADFTLTASVLLYQQVTNSGLFSTGGGGRYFAISPDGLTMRYRYEGSGNRVLNISGGFPFGELVTLAIRRVGTFMFLDINGVTVGSDNFTNAAAVYLITHIGDEFGTPKWHGLIYDVDIAGQLTWDGTIAEGDTIGTLVGSPVSVGQKRATIPQTGAVNWNRLMWFDGVDDYITSDEPFNWGADFSLSFWERGDFTDANTAAEIFGSSVSQAYGFGTDSSLGQYRLMIGGFSAGVNAFRAINAGVSFDVDKFWEIDRSGNDFVIKCNGVTVVAASLSAPSTTTDNLQFGRSGDALGTGRRYHRGTIRDFSSGSITWYGSPVEAEANGWTVNGAPVSALVSASDANDQIDAFGTAILEPRLNNQQINLAGEGEYALTPDSDSLDVTTEATWEIWGNFYGTDAVEYLLSKYVTTGDQRSWAIAIRPELADNVVRLLTGDGTGVSNLDLTGTTDSFGQLVITYSGGTAVGYWNSSVMSQSGNTKPALHAGTALVEIGSTVGGTAAFASRKIGSAKIYPTALTADQVLLNYNSQKSKYGL